MDHSDDAPDYGGRSRLGGRRAGELETLGCASFKGGGWHVQPRHLYPTMGSLTAASSPAERKPRLLAIGAAAGTARHTQSAIRAWLPTATFSTIRELC